MNAALHPSAAPPTVRAPWPDEIPRLARAFPWLPFAPPLHLRVLVVPAEASRPERLVGLAALAPPAAPQSDATLFFNVRPRFATTPAAHALLAEILAVADAQTPPGIRTFAPSAGDPGGAVLKRAAFGAVAGGDYWRRPSAASPPPGQALRDNPAGA